MPRTDSGLVVPCADQENMTGMQFTQSVILLTSPLICKYSGHAMLPYMFIHGFQLSSLSNHCFPVNGIFLEELM